MSEEKEQTKFPIIVTSVKIPYQPYDVRIEVMPLYLGNEWIDYDTWESRFPAVGLSGS